MTRIGGFSLPRYVGSRHPQGFLEVGYGFRYAVQEPARSVAGRRQKCHECLFSSNGIGGALGCFAGKVDRAENRTSHIVARTAAGDVLLQEREVFGVEPETLLFGSAGSAVDGGLLLAVAAKRTKRAGDVSEVTMVEEVSPEFEIDRLAVSGVEAAHGEVASKHHGRGLSNKVFVGKQAVDKGNATGIQARCFKVISDRGGLGVFVNDCSRAGDKSGLRIGIQRCTECGHRVGRGLVVVAEKIFDILSLHLLQTPVPVCCHAEIGGVQMVTDAWITAGIAPYDLGAVIFRGVVADEEFPVGILLRKNRLDSLGEVTSLVVARNNDTDAWHSEVGGSWF